MNSTYYKQIEQKVLMLLFNNRKDFLTGIYDNEDIFAEFDNKIILAEFKFRQFNHLRFKDEWWMQTKKYNDMHNKAKQQSKPTKIYYINLFTNNHLVIWDITNITYSPYIRMMNETSSTDFKNSGIKVPKEVFNLSIDDALHILDISKII